MTSQRYATANAFKTAVEQRLRTNATATRMDLNRRRQLFVFDRCLSRVFAVLKGGMVIELRLKQARTTKDLDLRVTGQPDAVLERLREAGRLDLGDYLQFEVQPDPRRPEIDAEGMTYQGLRFRATGQLAGQIYGSPFGIDVAFAEPMHGTPEVIEGSGFLEFAGIAPGRFLVYPLETHIAEKLHAYTLPRSRPNSRVKDLPDLALLATLRDLDGSTLRLAIDRTFQHRDTHSVPRHLPDPPERMGSGVRTHRNNGQAPLGYSGRSDQSGAFLPRPPLDPNARELEPRRLEVAPRTRAIELYTPRRTRRSLPDRASRRAVRHDIRDSVGAALAKSAASHPAQSVRSLGLSLAPSVLSRQLRCCATLPVSQ